MMMSIIISKAWYEDIEGQVTMHDPYFFDEHGWTKVEVDVDEEEFNRVSMENGWL
jgi:hypothetical protein